MTAIRYLQATNKWLVATYKQLQSEQTRNIETIADRRYNDSALGRFDNNAQESSRKYKSRE